MRKWKGRPPNSGPSPGNIEPRRPFEVVSMDFVTHLPSRCEETRSYFSSRTCSPDTSCANRWIRLLLKTSQKPMRKRVFRNFGANSLLRHDQDPRFMSEVFTRFRELLGSRQRATSRIAFKPMVSKNVRSKRLFGASGHTLRKRTKDTGMTMWNVSCLR